MDLKSMLNDSGQRPPRIHTHSSHSQTPQSSYDVRLDHTPGSDGSSARPTPYPYGPPSQILETRAHGGGSAGTGGNGSYFAIQSPHPNTSTSASTPSAGPHSAYAQSPGSFMGPYTPRDNLSTSNTAAAAAHSATFVSPTPTHQPIPPTPASVHHHNYSRSTSYNNSAHPHNHAQFQSPPQQMNGLPSSTARHTSPNNQFQSQPATPLGPPIHYPKASPQSYRPPSQGQEAHLRRASQSSMSSVLSNRDYPQYPPPLPTELSRRESVQRSYTYDSRDRERSISVSPKTIPKPPPQRDHELPRNPSHDRTSIPPLTETVTRPAVSHQNSLELQPVSTPDSQFAPPSVSMYNSPQASRSSEQPMQQIYDLMPSSNDIANANRQHTSLKRRASHLSDIIAKPPQKKPRRDEIPIWARPARNPDKQKPIRFVEGRFKREQPSQQPAPPQPARKEQPQPAPHPKPNGNSIVPKPEPIELPQSDQPNIANRIQFDVLTPTICEWVLHHIGRTDPPPGSKFEIEAKVGIIIRNDTDSRIDPMVWTEAVLTEQAVHNTKFHSGMTLDQHKAMNEYLNELVRQNTAAGHVGTSNEIFYSHPKENDEFYELSEEGRNHLSPELHHWIMKGSHAKRRNEIRVRRTVDKSSGAVTAQIIKTRIADINITCPQNQFDYRISISLETDWEGDISWLTPLAETRGRNKDRMSYRHRMYQVDLTQVSHEDSRNLEHELEVEIATEFLQRELQRLRATGESSLYDVIHGLISNIRIFTKLGQ